MSFVSPARVANCPFFCYDLRIHFFFSSLRLSHMYAIIIASFVSIATFFALYLSETSNWGWAFLFAVIGFVASMSIVGLVVRRKVNAVMSDVQLSIQEEQKLLSRKVKQFTAKPNGDPRLLQKQLMEEQKNMIRKALVMTESLNRFVNWIPLFQRQINTIRLQFHYQLGDFKKVDALLPKCIIIDPMTASLKIARQFSNQANLDDIKKTFEAARRRARYDQGLLLYSLMAWIYVQNLKIDEAIAVLELAKKNNHVDDEGPGSTIKRNLDALRNNRIKQFNNSGLGDQWWLLQLEQPKIRFERQTRPPRYGHF